jgi:hypothetical protein
LADNSNLIFQYYQVVAENLSDEEIMGLKEMFRSLDTNNSGTITLDELRSGLPKLGTKISESEIRQIMEAACTLSRPICFIFSFFLVEYVFQYAFFVVNFYYKQLSQFSRLHWIPLFPFKRIFIQISNGQ